MNKSQKEKVERYFTTLKGYVDDNRHVVRYDVMAIDSMTIEGGVVAAEEFHGPAFTFDTAKNSYADFLFIFKRISTQKVTIENVIVNV